MIYSTEEAKKIQVSVSKYLPAGIHDDVVFEGVRTETNTARGNKFIEFKFNKNNQEFKHTEWEPKKSPNMDDEAYQNRITNQVNKIMQILKCWYTPEQLTFAGDNFDAFIKWAADLLEQVDKTKLLKAKIVYNEKNFTAFPKYSKFTFIEPMNLPEGTNSSIIKLEGIDQFTKVVIPDSEKKDENPLAANTATTTASDDLPF